jgi:hypothetical protein
LRISASTLSFQCWLAKYGQGASTPSIPAVGAHNSLEVRATDYTSPAVVD